MANKPVTEAPGSLSMRETMKSPLALTTNPIAPENQQLSNEAVSRQLAEISRMLAQFTSQVAIGPGCTSFSP